MKVYRPTRSKLLSLLFTSAIACNTADTSAPSDNRAATISVEPTTVALPQLASALLAVHVYNRFGHEIVDPVVSYATGNPAVITVSASGLITSNGPSGSTTVSIQADTVTAIVPVTVTQLPTSIAVKNPQRLLSGSSLQLQATVLDATKVPMPSQSVVFSSTASAIFVTSAGLVTSLGPAGTFDVIAKSGSLATTVRLVVPTHPNGLLVATLPVFSGPWGVAISPLDVTYLAAPTDVTLYRITLPQFTFQGPVMGIPPASPFDVAFSSDGATAFAPALLPGALAIIDVASNQIVDSVTDLPTGLRSVAVAASDSLVFVGGGNDTLYVLNVHSRTIVGRTNLAHLAYALVLAPDGQSVFASSPEGHVALEIDAATFQVLQTFPVGGQPQGIAISPDAQELYIANELGWVLVWDPIANAAKDSVALDGGPFGLAMTPDAAQLYVSLPTSTHASIAIIDRLSRAVVGNIPTGGSPRRIAFSFSGQMAVIANNGSSAQLVQ